jgi:hypothetical protein
MVNLSKTLYGERGWWGRKGRGMTRCKGGRISGEHAPNFTLSTRAAPPHPTPNCAVLNSNTLIGLSRHHHTSLRDQYGHRQPRCSRVADTRPIKVSFDSNRMRPVFAAIAPLQKCSVEWQRSEKYGRNLIRLTPAKGLHACFPTGSRH